LEDSPKIINPKVNPGLVIWDEIIHIFLPILPQIIYYSKFESKEKEETVAELENVSTSL
jgi:hypothetical protein